MIALSVAKLNIFFAGKRNFSLNKAKVESVDRFRRLEVREKVRNVFVMSLRLSGERRGGLIVSALDSGARGPGSGLGRGRCVVFVGKTIYSNGASLSPPRCINGYRRM